MDTMYPKLVVVSGAEQGASLPIAEDRFSIGRGRSNNLCIRDDSASREHCVIVRQDGNFILRDLESHNGTRLNDVAVTEQPLGHRDYITVGRTVLQFLLREDLAFEDTAHAATMTRSAYQDATPSLARLATADLHALLKISTMLQSFQAIYKGRASSVRNSLEQQLLALIVGIIPATSGAILLYEDYMDEPSSVSIAGQRTDVHRPLTINRQTVKRALTEGCGLLVDSPVEGAEAQACLLVAPLTIHERPCGVIYLEGAQFSETHLDLLVAIAQMASMAIENASQLEWFAAENERLEAELHPDHHMIGDSAPLRELRRTIARAAQTNSTVLILGETGTGKELVARTIHQNSPRAGRPFVAINCAALSETLLESELFGYERGAFTGAFSQKKGRLEMAESGTVFLDEIGEVPLQLQAKLLRVLQERQVERVGGTQPVKLDIRLIAATNRNLEEEVRGARFRADLFYRLNVVMLKTAPLRDRRADIPHLAKHFALKFGEQCGRRIAGIAPDAEAYLCHYEWPGNIRELENALERAVVLGSGDIIQLEDLPESIREISKAAGIGRTVPLQDAIDDAKRQAISRAFEQASGEHPVAARLLGVHPNYLYRLMRNLGIR
jgi:transcriptional regulator with GAF, ATPase, and Fis domain